MGAVDDNIHSERGDYNQLNEETTGVKKALTSFIRKLKADC